MRTQTKYIDTFVAAMEAGSFVRAADQLHVTPSTVSYQIRHLEGWLGAALFERSGRKVLPTALAERLFSICGQFIDEMEMLRSTARGHRGAARQALRLATGSSFGRYVLTPLLGDPAYADTVINLRFGMDDDVCAAVAAGRADLGFSYTVLASNNLTFSLVYRYPLVLIAPPAWQAGGALLEDIMDAGFITYDDCETTFARWFETEWGAMPPHIRTMGRCTEVEETIAMVAAGRGLSIVPAYMLGTALTNGQIKTVGVSGASPEDTVFLVLRKGSVQDATASRLIESIHGPGTTR